MRTGLRSGWFVYGLLVGLRADGRGGVVTTEEGDRRISPLVEPMGPGRRNVEVVTWPGFPKWEGISVAQHLLAWHAQLCAGERVLVWPSGHGALGVWAALEVGASQVILCDTNWLAARASEATARRNGVPNVDIVLGLPHEAKGPVDAALMPLPKGRHFTRLGLMSCFTAMRPGGRLYLAGANAEGIRSAVRDCVALFGPGTVLAYKGGNRILTYRRPDELPEPLPKPYREPGVAPGTWREMALTLPDGMRYTFRSLPGVFSWRGLDEGTRLLLEVLRVADDERVLDVGCGYGPIGVWAARQAQRGHVTMVDVDVLAVRSARESLRLNGVTNAEVVLGDGARAAGGRTFTLVVSNPPFHSGHSTDLQVAAGFIREAQALLERRGRLVVVANRFLPYERLMRDWFRHVRVLADTRRYWVLSAVR